MIPCRRMGAAAVLLALPLAAFRAASRPDRRSAEGWQAELLERWLSSAEQHEPGNVDSALLEATHWTRADLRQLWLDVQVLMRLVATTRTPLPRAAARQPAVGVAGDHRSQRRGPCAARGPRQSRPQG